MGFYFNLFGKDKEGLIRDRLSEYSYLLLLMNIWPRDWKNKLKRTNMKVDKENGKAAGMVNGRYQKFRWFSSNKFWKNIGCLIFISYILS